jgi:hypothetical protein
MFEESKNIMSIKSLQRTPHTSRRRILQSLQSLRSWRTRHSNGCPSSDRSAPRCVQKMIEELKAYFYIVLYLFNLIGIKTMDDLKRRFGNPDISMPSSSGKEEWTDALQNVCREKKLNLEAMSYKFIEEERSQPPKNLVTHIWFLWPYRHIIIVKEYDVGQPEITIGYCKLQYSNRG